MTTSITGKPANFTRQSKSFVTKFIREGRYHFIPLYWLLGLSDFAREGMAKSGSWRFADHMYRGVPSGRGLLGRWLDGLLMRLPATRSMRSRCFASRDEMRTAFDAHREREGVAPFRILTVPCGLPRDVRDCAAGLGQTFRDRIKYTGLDLDPEASAAAREFLTGTAIAGADLKVGDALDPAAYPATPQHFIASTGLGEFLDDASLACFYQNVFDALAPGGTFFTSAAARGGGSATLLSAFEFEVRYRTREDIKRLLGLQPWEAVEFRHDDVGLQTFVRARKGGSR